MASACVNNIGMPTESFLDSPAVYKSYGWLSPRVSLSREFHDDKPLKTGGGGKSPSQAQSKKAADPAEVTDLDPEVFGEDINDFEFRLEDPVTMLPADELFSDGKLVPLQVSTIRPTASFTAESSVTRSPETPKSRWRSEICGTDEYLFSPKAPRCSSRWKEILGLKKLYQSNNARQENNKTLLSTSSHSSNAAKSLKNFLHRSSKSSNSTLDSSLSLPLLKDSDNESVSISARLSLSSSSSGHDHDDLPRHSLDSEKPVAIQKPVSLSRNSNPNPNPNPRRVKVAVKPRALSSENPTAARVGRSPMRRAPDTTSITVQGVSIDSPRMNSSGKIVFHSLERSSSSPSSFNGGPRLKYRGMERSYSANVRVTPVLNVPVCSLRGSSKPGVFGFPLFSAPQKRDSAAAASGVGNRAQHTNGKIRADRV